VTVFANRREAIRAEARSLVAAHGVTAAPVPVDRIAKAMGISVRYAPLEDELSGMAFVKDDVRVIAVNALHHPNRQRFTIAHEMAHHVLHASTLAEGVHVDKVILRRDMLSATGTDDLEVEANTFASELLMPRDLMAPVVDQFVDLNDEAQLTAVARRFRVSTAALQFRLASLN
jgi:Zn-dependent peptidase ImmA (M78 family)